LVAGNIVAGDFIHLRLLNVSVMCRDLRRL